MKLGLDGRRALVPGASSGLGLAVARALREEGAEVAICSSDRDRVSAAAEAIGAIGLTADVTSKAGAVGLVSEAAERLGGLDILVLNGPGPPPGTFESTKVEGYEDALLAGVVPPIAMCRATVPSMRERGWGRVLAITSIGVRQPIPNLMLSNTARTGLTGFLKTMAREVAADGVTVNSLQPGLHQTKRLEAVYGDDLDAQTESIPARSLGQAEDFGAIAAFLCSDHAKYVTGAAIPVDGGMYAALQ